MYRKKRSEILWCLFIEISLDYLWKKISIENVLIKENNIYNVLNYFSTCNNVQYSAYVYTSNGYVSKVKELSQYYAGLDFTSCGYLTHSYKSVALYYIRDLFRRNIDVTFSLIDVVPFYNTVI